MGCKSIVSAEIVGGEVRITLGVEHLAHLARYLPGLQGWDGEKLVEPVVDAPAFAVAVVRELRREKEDGTTPVHEMLDAAIMAAAENGAEGIEVTDDVPTTEGSDDTADGRESGE